MRCVLNLSVSDDGRALTKWVWFFMDTRGVSQSGRCRFSIPADIIPHENAHPVLAFISKTEHGSGGFF